MKPFLRYNKMDLTTRFFCKIDDEKWEGLEIGMSFTYLIKKLRK